MKRVDAHWDTSMFLDDNESLEHLPHAHCDFQRMREYIDIAFFAMYFDINKTPEERRYAVFSKRLDLLLTDIARPESGVQLLLNADRIADSGKLALISAEGGEFLGGESTAIQRLEETFAKGLRGLGMTWNYANALAGGCGKGEGGGLTPLGKQVVEHCNNLGILLDAAHLAPESLADLLRIGKKPIIVSHTCCAALCPEWHPRNLNDAQLRAVAEHGGVVGIAFVPDFLGGMPGVARVAEHISHAVNVAGIDHVGIGSDFDGTELPDDIHGLQSLPLVYAQLEESGFTEAELEKIIGGNFCRLLSEVLP